VFCLAVAVVGPLVYVMDVSDRIISKLCPFIAGGIFIGSVYWTAVTYGAVTVMQVNLSLVIVNAGAFFVPESFECWCNATTLSCYIHLTYRLMICTQFCISWFLNSLGNISIEGKTNNIATMCQPGRSQYKGTRQR